MIISNLLQLSSFCRKQNKSEFIIQSLWKTKNKCFIFHPKYNCFLIFFLSLVQIQIIIQLSWSAQWLNFTVCFSWRWFTAVIRLSLSWSSSLCILLLLQLSIAGVVILAWTYLNCVWVTWISRGEKRLKSLGCQSTNYIFVYFCIDIHLIVCCLQSLSCFRFMFRGLLHWLYLMILKEKRCINKAHWNCGLNVFFSPPLNVFPLQHQCQ